MEVESTYDQQEDKGKGWKRRGVERLEEEATLRQTQLRENKAAVPKVAQHDCTDSIHSLTLLCVCMPASK